MEHRHHPENNSPLTALQDLDRQFDKKKELHKVECVEISSVKDECHYNHTNALRNGVVTSKVKKFPRNRTEQCMSESDIPDELMKYWMQRYRIFHRFDEGIQMDEEGWFSVTPEWIAIEIARRFRGMDVILDAFCGCGGNTIQFARNGSIVIGIDHSQKRITMAQNNARVYDIDHYIDFIQGDVYEIMPTINQRVGAIDGIFISPPWGGPSYLNSKTYDVSIFKKVVDEARRITPNIALLIPRNVEYQDIFDIFGPCEVQQNCLNGKVKTQTLYFGCLISNITDSVGVLDLEPTYVPTGIEKTSRYDLEPTYIPTGIENTFRYDLGPTSVPTGIEKPSRKRKRGRRGSRSRRWRKK